MQASCKNAREKIENLEQEGRVDIQPVMLYKLITALA